MKCSKCGKDYPYLLASSENFLKGDMKEKGLCEKCASRKFGLHVKCNECGLYYRKEEVVDGKCINCL